jgi:Putative zinc-finger
MEGTPLRSVPARPPGPVEPAEALAHVERRLPELAPAAREALAIVDLVGRPRADAAEELGVDPAALSDALVAARKALRRTLEPLPAGGWCERAERLISDRLDGVLTPSGAARLDAHLRGCDRCITHERRLIQAHDQLVESLGGERDGGATPPELRVVEPALEGTRRSVLWYALLVIAVLLVVAAAVVGVLAAIGG